MYQLRLKAGIKKGIQITDNVIESLIKDKKESNTRVEHGLSKKQVRC